MLVNVSLRQGFFGNFLVGLKTFQVLFTSIGENKNFEVFDGRFSLFSSYIVVINISKFYSRSIAIQASSSNVKICFQRSQTGPP